MARTSRDLGEFERVISFSQSIEGNSSRDRSDEIHSYFPSRSESIEKITTGAI